MLFGSGVHDCEGITEQEVGINLHQKCREVVLEALLEELQLKNQEGGETVHREWKHFKTQATVDAIGVDDGQQRKAEHCDIETEEDPLAA